MLAFIAAALLSTPSPAASPTPSTVHKLTLNIPPGWRRTESGQYNEWVSPDGSSDFRVTPMAPFKELSGAGAADAVKAQFVKVVAMFHTNSNIVVKTVSVCNGTQAAYRVDDALGLGTPGFMMIIPGTISTGLINYEVHPGASADPAIEQTVDAICWP